MSIDASPPAQPPQLSPDGKWVWDGSQWQPVVGVEPTHTAVFAAWNSIKAEPADPVAAAPQPAAVQFEPQYQEPAPVVDYSYAAAEPSTPLWQQPKSAGVSTYLYVGAGLVVLVMAMIVINSMNLVHLPWPGAGSSSSSQSPKPTPSPNASDFVRADRFLNGKLAPSLVTLNGTLPALQQCNGGTLSNSCYQAVKGTEAQMQNVLTVIDHGDIPLCIAGPMNKVRQDLAGMDGGLQIALNGFQSNRADILANGLNVFRTKAQPLQADGNAVDLAEKVCPH